MFSKMKLKKAIFVLTDSNDQHVAESAIQLCKKFKSKLFVLFIIETGRISRLARLTQKKSNMLRKKIEDDGWQSLYLIEDEADKTGVSTSLHLENGVVTTIVKKYVDAYNIDTLLVKRKNETHKLFVSSAVPVIGL
ncbi:MAG: hypothetical protein WBB67_09310 [bacterium]